MKSLHSLNMNNIKRRQNENHKTIQQYLDKKSNYFEIAHRKI